MRTFLSIVIFLLSAGCIPYPIYKTLQPQAQVQVMNASGTPIAGAKVHLIGSAYPYGQEKFRVIAETTGQGRADFFKVKDFRVEAIMLHGAESFFWNWCVENVGYKSIRTSFHNANQFDRHSTFILEIGESESCSDSTANNDAKSRALNSISEPQMKEKR